MLKYRSNQNQTGEFIPICYQKSIPFPKLDTSYSVYFFVDINGNQCKKDTCLTKYETSSGYNIGEVFYESEKIRKENHARTNIFIPIMSVLIVILVAVFIYILVKNIQQNKKDHDRYRF